MSHAQWMLSSPVNVVLWDTTAIEGHADVETDTDEWLQN